MKMQKLIDKAKNAGFSDCEVYYNSSKSFSVSVYEGKIEKYQNTATEGISLRGIFNGRMGCSYTENMSEEAFDIVVENAKQNSLINDSEYDEKIFEGSEKYPPCSTCYNAEIFEMTDQKCIDIALRAEKAALGYSEKIKSCESCKVGKAETETVIINTKGINLKNKISYITLYVSALAEEKEQVKEGYEIRASFDPDGINPEETGRSAAEKAVRKLGAKSVKSGKYNVIMRSEPFCDLLGCFVSAFYAENVQKGFSLLKGKLGKKIASDCLTVFDDALMEKGFASHPFDSEGVACQKKCIIERGILKDYLYNTKTADKDGRKSNGNGFRGSYKGTVSTGITNLIAESGSVSYDDMLKIMGSGIIITDLTGLHSGTNSISGDFSVSAEGILLENKKFFPVEQITLSGNFYSLIKNIKMFSDDFKQQISGIGSSSVFIGEAEISGL